jgi:hypothetical protein
LPFGKKKGADDDLGEDLTGDIDVSELDETDEDHEDEEEQSSKASPVWSFIDNQLPFLGKLLSRFRKDSSDEDEDEDEDEDLESEDNVDLEDVTAKDISTPTVDSDDNQDSASVEVDKELELEDLDEDFNDELDDDDDDDDDDDVTQVNGIKGKLASLKNLLSKKKNKNTDSDEDDDEESDEANVESDSKRKFKITPIHAIVILGLLVFVLFDEEGDSPDTKSQVKVKEVKTKVKASPKKESNTQKNNIKENPVVQKTDPKKDVTEKSDSSLAVDIPSGDEFTNEAAVDKSLEEKKINSNQKDDSKNQMATEVEKTELKDLFVTEDLPDPEDTLKQDTIKDKELDSTDDSMSNESMSNESMSKNDVTSEASGEVTSVGQREVEVIDLTNTKTGISNEILDNLELKVKEQRKKEKFQRSLSPVAAPDYNDIGRALVYNCKGQHWACVSTRSYKECGQNYNWNSTQGKMIECYPVETYMDDFDCESMQQFKIDSVANTDFCKSENE